MYTTTPQSDALAVLPNTMKTHRFTHFGTSFWVHTQEETKNNRIAGTQQIRNLSVRNSRKVETAIESHRVGTKNGGQAQLGDCCAVASVAAQVAPEFRPIGIVVPANVMDMTETLV